MTDNNLLAKGIMLAGMNRHRYSISTVSKT